MSDELLSRLLPVRRRQHVRRLLHTAAVGWLLGSVIAVLLALARFWDPALSPMWSLAASGAGLLIGIVSGLIWQRTWSQAARAVDVHYHLKDRTTSALAFLHNPKAGDVHQLQIADAVEHLANVDACEVTPLRMPRPLPYALAALLLAVALVLWPLSRPDLQAGPAAPLAAIVDEAQRLEATMLPELEELAAREEDERLEQLVEELKELIHEMQEPGVDLREALAKLSQMEAAVAEAKGEFNLEEVDSSLQELGEALSPAAAMKSASAALKEGKYDKAAEQLEQFDSSELSNKEARTLAENLKKLAKKMLDKGQGQLGEATGDLSEGLESDNESQCKGGACKLAAAAKKQGLRKAIGQCLGCQLSLLAECKSNCQNCKNGGLGTAKSDSPKLSWGLGASGKPLGDESTTLGSKLNREEITGQHGDGPSEREVTHSPEGRQEATREYREKYAEYRRMSEAVLESEPLPLGYRQTIRRYFESIRPQQSDATATQQ